MLKLPTRLICTVRAKRARSCAPSLPSTFSPLAMPAQLTAPCSAPKREQARSTAACASASRVTSQGLNTACSPSDAASASPASRLRSAITTRAPRPARKRAVAPPRPEAPPVTMKVCWSICMGFSSGGDGVDGRAN
jgi:hypothetical protein